ncbi:hypothetical protein M404DRAFT_78898, partial [Pisolithus tinctorius Marx 270]
DPDELAKWQKSENMAKHLLTQQIPDSTALQVHNLSNVTAMWNEIVHEYTEKGAYAQTDLRTKFLSSQCPTDGDIRQFLDDLRTKRDELAAVGVQIEEKDYRSTIIQSLPKYLASFASGQLVTARLYSPMQTIDPDVLISLIIEESERRSRKETRYARSKAKNRDGDEAMSLTPGNPFGRGRGNGRNGSRGGSSRGHACQRGPCWNCGSREHYKSQCPNPDKTKKEGSSATMKGSAHAVTLDSDEEGAFSVHTLDEFDDEVTLPDLLSDDEDLPYDSANLVNDSPISAPIVELYDSGSTRHISPYKEKFERLTPIPPRLFSAANRQLFDATAMGELVIEVPNGYDVTKLRLTEVLYSPEVGYTLVSIGRLDQLGYSVTFAEGTCTIRNPADDVVGRIPKSKAGLYRVIHDDDCDSINAAAETITVMELHRRMGHISPSVTRCLAEKGLVSGLKFDLSKDEPTFCKACVYAKATRKPVAKERVGERAAEFAEEVHTDLWGPAPVETLGGRRYYITFTDDKTRLTYIHLLRQKSEAFMAYKEFEAACCTQHNARVKTLHSDRGGEYLGREFVMYLKTAGTKQKLTMHDTPQHNGVAEHLNRTLLEKVRAMLHESSLPHTLWGEAVRHAVWLKNRTPTKALDGGTPLEAATGKKPDLSRARAWGSNIWVRIEGGSKLGGRVAEGRWVGIDDNSLNGCRIYWPEKKSVTVERNVYWNPSSAEALPREGEEEDNYLPNVMLTSTAPVAETVVAPSPPPVTPAQSVPPSPPAEPPEDAAALLASIVEDSDDDLCRIDLTMAMDEVIAETEALEPSSLAEARRHPDWPRWEEGIREELDTLKEAGTWELVDLPSGANIVGSKWVFRAKKDAAGNVVRYKARLVAQGFSQVEGIDYFDTFAPVATLASIRVVLAMAARSNLELHQIDIKGAYLNGTLTDDEVIYMRQPPGFESVDHPQKVCRLRKTLYGLKQSGCRWYQRLVEILVDELKFTHCSVDQAVYFRRRSTGELIIIVVHVDDCTIAATLLSEIEEFKKDIRKHVEITDLGELHWLLGIEVTRNRDDRAISLCQRPYIESIIRRFGFDELKPVSNPMEPSTKLHSGQSPSTGAEFAAMKHIPYREAVGSLMYASLSTRPDISYAVTTVSCFSGNPGIPHWEAVRRIYRYLIGTKNLKLTYGGAPNALVGYADADGSMAEDRRAVSGYAFLIDGGAVSWSSKRQKIVSLSTTESEYVAATHAAKEALWLRSLIGELFGPLVEPTTLFSDNQSAIALTKDHQYHARTKHIDIRFHFIRWVVENGKIRLIYCPTADMITDTLTKALPSPKVKHFAFELGL